MNLRAPLTGTGYDVNRGLALVLLAFVVAAPAACVLWFMNEAMTSQRDASREKLAAAYRGQLQLLRDKLGADWEKRAVSLDRAAETLAAPALFDQTISASAADSVIILDAGGHPAYPAPLAFHPADAEVSDPAWLAARSMESQGFFTGAADSYARIAAAAREPSLAARASQGQIRCLLKSGNKPAAIAAILDRFSTGPAASATDSQGRWIAGDEFLLALSALDPADPRRAAFTARLQEALANYSSLPIPAPQRLFLMREMHENFPTLAAEQLAAQFLDAQPAPTGSGELEPSGLPDTWRLRTPGNRAILLYRTATVLATMRRVIGRDAPFDVAPPAPATSTAWTAIGPLFPNWRITDPSSLPVLDGAGAPRVTRYAWIALAAILAIVLVAGVAAYFLRRQWQLARLKTDLVAAVSHELKTPLASVRLLVETLLEDERPEGRTREYLELIARENQRLSRLIGNFLTFSRLERNLRRFDIRATAPERVVEAVVASAYDRMPSPECRLEIDVAPGLPAVRADEDALVTALLNLLDNAYKYSPGEKRIRLRAACEDGHVIFAVTDHGIGIAARERRRIFRRFYQVDRRLARESGGVGLGLSIVDFIVRAHGGSVRVESEPGKGSTFSVVMP